MQNHGVGHQPAPRRRSDGRSGEGRHHDGDRQHATATQPPVWAQTAELKRRSNAVELKKLQTKKDADRTRRRDGSGVEEAFIMMRIQKLCELRLPKL